MFTVAMMLYAAASACIGATPAAYAADVMPQSVSGFGLGIYRCAGDIGGSALALLPQHPYLSRDSKDNVSNGRLSEHIWVAAYGSDAQQ